MYLNPKATFYTAFEQQVNGQYVDQKYRNKRRLTGRRSNDTLSGNSE